MSENLEEIQGFGENPRNSQSMSEIPRETVKIENVLWKPNRSAEWLFIFDGDYFTFPLESLRPFKNLWDSLRVSQSLWDSVRFSNNLILVAFLRDSLRFSELCHYPRILDFFLNSSGSLWFFQILCGSMGFFRDSFIFLAFLSESWSFLDSVRFSGFCDSVNFFEILWKSQRSCEILSNSRKFSEMRWSSEKCIGNLKNNLQDSWRLSQILQEAEGPLYSRKSLRSLRCSENVWDSCEVYKSPCVSMITFDALWNSCRIADIYRCYDICDNSWNSLRRYALRFPESLWESNRFL